jgi:hypothetical protein
VILDGSGIPYHKHTVTVISCDLRRRTSERWWWPSKCPVRTAIHVGTFRISPQTSGAVESETFVPDLMSRNAVAKNDLAELLREAVK